MEYFNTSNVLDCVSRILLWIVHFNESIITIESLLYFWVEDLLLFQKVVTIRLSIHRVIIDQIEILLYVKS